jgi:uncharacterized protein YcbK (DUF882 family)
MGARVARPHLHLEEPVFTRFPLLIAKACDACDVPEDAQTVCCHCDVHISCHADASVPPHDGAWLSTDRRSTRGVAARLAVVVTSRMRRWLPLALLLVATGSAEAGGVHDPRVLWMSNAHTGEEIRLRPFALRGRPSPMAWRRLDRFFRSWRTDLRRTTHPRLLRELAHLQRCGGGRRLEVISGYRVTREPLGASYHSVGRAADVHIDGVADRALFELCRSRPRLGCGLYPHGHHVHVDIRRRPGVWVDLSAPGRGSGPAYARDARRWLKEHPP